MATLTVQNKTETGAVITFASAAGGGDVADNSSGDTILILNNASGGDLTVTVTPQQNTDATNTSHGILTKAALATVVAAGEIWSIGPFRPNTYNNSSNQIVITYSGVGSLSIAAQTFKFPTP